MPGTSGCTSQSSSPTCPVTRCSASRCGTAAGPASAKLPSQDREKAVRILQSSANLYFNNTVSHQSILRLPQPNGQKVGGGRDGEGEWVEARVQDAAGGGLRAEGELLLLPVLHHSHQVREHAVQPPHRPLVAGYFEFAQYSFPLCNFCVEIESEIFCRAGQGSKK